MSKYESKITWAKVAIQKVVTEAVAEMETVLVTCRPGYNYVIKIKPAELGDDPLDEALWLSMVANVPQDEAASYVAHQREHAHKEWELSQAPDVQALPSAEQFGHAGAYCTCDQCEKGRATKMPSRAVFDALFGEAT